jgi:hypothetical protein
MEEGWKVGIERSVWLFFPCHGEGTTTGPRTETMTLARNWCEVTELCTKQAL